MLWWFKQCENCLKVMWVFWVDLCPLMGASGNCGWCRNVPMCLRNLQKHLVHGALIEAEILTSPLPMYLLNLAWYLGPGALPTGVSTPPEWSRNVPMCLRNLQKNLVHGALIEAEILTSPLPHAFAQFSPVLGTGTLSTGVLTPPRNSTCFLPMSTWMKRNHLKHQHPRPS